MAARQAMESAFKAADTRLDRLAPLIEAYGDDRLLDDDGKWSVRDALAHVALSALVSTFGQRALARARREASAPAPAAPGAPSMDDRNRPAIDAIANKSITDLVTQAKQEHADSWEDIRAMSDTDIDTKVPPMQAGGMTQSVGGIILRTLEYHEAGQMERIEAALKMHTRWV